MQRNVLSIPPCFINVFSNYKEFGPWSCGWWLIGRQKPCHHLILHVSPSHLHLAGKSRRPKKREWMVLIISAGIMSMSVWAGWYNGRSCEIHRQSVEWRAGWVDCWVNDKNQQDVWLTFWGKQTVFCFYSVFRPANPALNISIVIFVWVVQSCDIERPNSDPTRW